MYAGILLRHGVFSLVIHFVISKNERGETALHVAVLQMNHRLTTMLLKAGADSTCVNFNLETPIHVAASIGALRFVIV